MANEQIKILRVNYSIPKEYQGQGSLSDATTETLSRNCDGLEGLYVIAPSENTASLDIISKDEQLANSIYNRIQTSFKEALPFLDQQILGQLQQAALKLLKKKDVALQAVEGQSRICIDIFNKKVTFFLVFKEMPVGPPNNQNAPSTVTITIQFSPTRSRKKEHGRGTVQEAAANTSPIQPVSLPVSTSENRQVIEIIPKNLSKDFEFNEGFEPFQEEPLVYAEEMNQLRTTDGGLEAVNRELMGFSCSAVSSETLTPEDIRTQLSPQIHDTETQNEILLCLRTSVTVTGLEQLNHALQTKLQKAKQTILNMDVQRKTIDKEKQTVTTEAYFKVASNDDDDSKRAIEIYKIVTIYDVQHNNAVVKIFKKQPNYLNNEDYLNKYCKKYKLSKKIAETIDITQDIPSQLQAKDTRTLVRKNIRLGFWNRLTILIAGLFHLNNFIINKLSKSIALIIEKLVNYNSIKQFICNYNQFLGENKSILAQQELKKLNILLHSLSILS